MNRTACFLYGCILYCVFNVVGCGGGTSGPPPPPPNPAPTISAITPSFVTAGSADIQVKISGSGFISSTTAQWNGAAISSTLVNGTELMATVPAADLAGSSASSITVENSAPGGGTSSGMTFDVNSPVAAITGISPRYVPPGTAATVTLTGTGFESNSVVMWNGTAKATTFVNSTTLTVSLSAGDLQNQGTGALTVSNPGPGASTSGTARLTVTSLPVPVIQRVSVTNIPGAPTGCAGLQVTITGQNFAYDSTIQANSVTLPTIFFGANPTTLVNNLPSGFTSAPGGLAFTVTNPDGGPITSNPYLYPTTMPAVLALCTAPSPTTVYATSSFSFTVQPSEVNVSGNGTLTLGNLPAGVTAASTSVPLPPTGATVHLQAASNTAAGEYDLALNAIAGSANAKGDFNFTVNTGAVPNFFLTAPQQTEVGVPIGGSGNIQFGSIVNSTSSVDFDITPSVSGLPPGTTATFSPNVFSPGQSFTITLNAASNAPVTQNASVTVIGTPSANVTNATSSFYADVTQPPGSLPGNRTDFVAIAGTPYAAVYDATHNLIFASNPDWNRVDVISNATHKIVKSVPVRSPRGIDITQDNSHVWVGTASLNVYGIDTSLLQTRHYSLPSQSVGSSGLPAQFSSDVLLALSDGTLLLFFKDSGGRVGQAAVWNPQTNQLTVLTSGAITGWGVPARSGDGTHVYAPYSVGLNSGTEYYNVSTQSVSLIGPGTGYLVVAVNGDGSRLVLQSGIGLGLYDGNVNLLGNIPGALTGFYGSGLVGGTGVQRGQFEAL